VASVNECHMSHVGPTLLSCTNGRLPCVNKNSLICCGVLLLCYHVALGVEVALPLSATWHAGGAHMLGQYGGEAHPAKMDQ
jgi:hypothetical protein